MLDKKLRNYVISEIVGNYFEEINKTEPKYMMLEREIKQILKNDSTKTFNRFEELINESDCILAEYMYKAGFQDAVDIFMKKTNK